MDALYHYERKLGTTTRTHQHRRQRQIIPLREKIGNYDARTVFIFLSSIIPLREKIGNYDLIRLHNTEVRIIPLREKIGNYDDWGGVGIYAKNYTTTRENWELRLIHPHGVVAEHYTTTRENWELRP